MAMSLAPRVAGRYQPGVGTNLVVLFPGEIMVCEVIEHVDANRVLVEVSGVPMSKSHQYRKGDRTGARRRVQNGRDVWEALDDRDFLANRSPAEPMPPPAEPEKPKRKTKRKVA